MPGRCKVEQLYAGLTLQQPGSGARTKLVSHVLGSGAEQALEGAHEPSQALMGNPWYSVAELGERSRALTRSSNVSANDTETGWQIANPSDPIL